MNEFDQIRPGGAEAMAESEQFSEKEHFEAIVRRYQGSLLRYVRAELGPEDAQDAVQEAFLRLHKTMKQNGLRDIGNLGTWLFRVAHNCAYDILRRRKTDERTREGAAVDSPNDNCTEQDGLDEVVHREDCRLALKLLDKLPAQEKQIILLKVQNGMTYREIGDITSLPLGTVGYLMNQGLGRLARELKSAGAI